MTGGGSTGAGDTDGSVPPVSAPAPDPLLDEPFTDTTVTALRHRLSAAAAAAGLSGTVGEDFVLAAHELVTNAVKHGGGAGRLRLRLLADVLVCEIIDHGRKAPELPIRLSQTDQPGGRGLWLAHRLTGALMLTRRPDGGVTASVSVCVGEAATPGRPANGPHAGDASPVTDSDGR
ncbi:ATP-binding protein [Actinoplanes sp. NEAU-A12]|uniref:ATP-binding protein n=1 Tax=Actinoplanes sandaracinus TaxID=3045177 RepID=A0ABT6WGC5_9ACTN|nr:ATP-binding protein [Actinoplanes sandaracinus]MDI6098781.1 ATP-binding protein [Actinoplanes sandaracinus]